jgi:hypothetical protein
MRLLLLAVAAPAPHRGGAPATLAISDHSVALAGSTTSAAPAVAPAAATEDGAGPCDEAKHANDARCAATTTTATRRRDGAGHGRRGRHAHRNPSPSASRPGGDDHDDHRGDDNGGHRGGGHGRDHAEDD